MTSTPPDISQLHISSGAEFDAFNDHQQPKTFHYASPPPPASLNPQFQYVPVTMGQQGLKKPARAGLPSHWLDSNNAQNAAGDRPPSPPLGSDHLSASTGSPPPSLPQIQPPQLYGSSALLTPGGQVSGMGEDEVIPTAIVIKNIPFTVRRETLLDIIASLNIPTPYAFNYHIDGQGQFRGLAFANFRMPEDADAVVAALNGFDVQGRKLRVEYKKVLLPPEKERIEREKAFRRMKSMQLEKERDAYQRGAMVNQTQEWDAFGPVQSHPFKDMPAPMGQQMLSPGGVSPPPIMPQMPNTSPTALRTYGAATGMGLGMSSSQSQPTLGLPRLSMPGSQGPPPPASYPSPPPPATPAKTIGSSTHELDMNDSATLDIYSRILVFKEDHMRDELAFSRTLSPKQRRIVHLVAQRLGVFHYSVGEGDDRHAVVTRRPHEERQSGLRMSGGGAPQSARTVRSLHRSPSGYLQGAAAQSSNIIDLQPNQDSSTLAPPRSLHTRPSMPNLNSANQYQRAATIDGITRLASRPSNGNLHERYATVVPSPRKRSDGFGLFGSNGSNDTSIPPVPSLPSLPALNGEASVVRQPRGPGNGSSGFARRPTMEARAGGSGGLDTRSHEPLEI